jgi:hypothetical protein
MEELVICNTIRFIKRKETSQVYTSCSAPFKTLKCVLALFSVQGRVAQKHEVLGCLKENEVLITMKLRLNVQS